MKILQAVSIVLLSLAGVTACTADSDDTESAVSNRITTGNLQRLSPGRYRIAEGPSWDGGSNVYFTSIGESRIYRYSLEKKITELVHEHTGASNGLVFSSDGHLWGCSQDSGSIFRMEVSGENFQVIAAGYKGKPFNHPNDISLDRFDGAYFTDPYWSDDGMNSQPVNGVYYVDNKGSVRLLVEDMDKPNGILLNTAGDFLYISDMGTDELRRYHVEAPGEISPVPEIYRLKIGTDDTAAVDGLAEDNQGNLFVATNSGVQVLSPGGEFIDLIPVPEWVTNVELYRDQGDHLFITTRSSIFSIRVY